MVFCRFRMSFVCFEQSAQTRASTYCLVSVQNVRLINKMDTMYRFADPHRLLLADFLGIHMRKSLSFRVPRTKDKKSAKKVRWF